MQLQSLLISCCVNQKGYKLKNLSGDGKVLHGKGSIISTLALPPSSFMFKPLSSESELDASPKANRINDHFSLSFKTVNSASECKNLILK